jgi:hypothetical protein
MNAKEVKRAIKEARTELSRNFNEAFKGHAGHKEYFAMLRGEIAGDAAFERDFDLRTKIGQLLMVRPAR